MLSGMYWSIVALWCCVSFCWAAKWVSCTHFFLDFFPISITTEHWGECPLLYSRCSLIIYLYIVLSTVNSGGMSTGVYASIWNYGFLQINTQGWNCWVMWCIFSEGFCIADVLSHIKNIFFNCLFLNIQKLSYIYIYIYISGFN